jgi:Phage tail assembly chaperone protein, TAC
MTPTFGAAALRLSGFAAQWLGWRPADFWNATPAELAAALTPVQQGIAEPLDRTVLYQMMENENDRCGGQPAD